MSKPDARVVGWVSQVIHDGSIGRSIVPANWTTTDERLAALNNEPWVLAGKAAVIGLVPLSLLAEAESRGDRLDAAYVDAWMQAQNEKDRADTLQSRLDAVAGLADRMEIAALDLLSVAETDSEMNHADFVNDTAKRIRAAIGGEPPPR